MIETTLHNTGLVLMQQQCIYDALKLFDEASQVRKEKQSEHQANIGQVWLNMGLEYRKLALSHFKQALHIHLHMYSELHIGNHYGIAYNSLHDYDNITGCIIKVVRTRKQSLSYEHIEIENANQNLCNKIYEETLETQDSSYSSVQHINKMDLANSLHAVAQLQKESGQYEMVLAHTQQTLELRWLVYDDTHLYLASILTAIALHVHRWDRNDNDFEVTHALNKLSYNYHNVKCDQYNLTRAVEYREAVLMCMLRESEICAKVLWKTAICSFDMPQGKSQRTHQTQTVIKAIFQLGICIAMHEKKIQDPASLKYIDRILELTKALYKGVHYMQSSSFSKTSNKASHAIDIDELIDAGTGSLCPQKQILHQSGDNDSALPIMVEMVWSLQNQCPTYIEKIYSFTVALTKKPLTSTGETAKLGKAFTVIFKHHALKPVSLPKSVALALQEAHMQGNAGDIFERIQSKQKVRQCYLNQHHYQKAINLARAHYPDQVTSLEKMWANCIVNVDHLAEVVLTFAIWKILHFGKKRSYVHLCAGMHYLFTKTVDEHNSSS
jgi:tetratricopeptide (TPR) repeat protein